MEIYPHAGKSENTCFKSTFKSKSFQCYKEISSLWNNFIEVKIKFWGKRSTGKRLRRICDKKWAASFKNKGNQSAISEPISRFKGTKSAVKQSFPNLQGGILNDFRFLSKKIKN